VLLLMPPPPPLLLLLLRTPNSRAAPMLACPALNPQLHR
jgi:hypothetical protein